MNKKLAIRIDTLLEKLVERAEHEVSTEEHEMTEEMVMAVTQLHNYKEVLSAQHGEEMRQMINGIISRAMASKGQKEQ
jgi:hypothetical protein